MPTKVTCAAKPHFLWRLTDKTTHKVYYGGSGRCGAVVFKNKLLPHQNSEACAGNPKFFAKYDAHIMESFRRVDEDKEHIPGLHIKKDNNGGKYVCLDEDFRRTPEVMMLTKEILTKPGFHKAVLSSEQLTMFFVTALGDGIEKYLDNVTASLMRIIEAFRVKGIEAFNFLGINSIDAEVMEDVVANMMDAVHVIKERVVGVEADVVRGTCRRVAPSHQPQGHRLPRRAMHVGSGPQPSANPNPNPNPNPLGLGLGLGLAAPCRSLGAVGLPQSPRGQP